MKDIHFIQLENNNGKYLTKRCVVFRDNVKYLREAPLFKKLLSEASLPEDLDSRHEFTEVTFNDGTSIIIICELSEASSRIYGDKRQLLQG